MKQITRNTKKKYRIQTIKNTSKGMGRSDKVNNERHQTQNCKEMMTQDYFLVRTIIFSFKKQSKCTLKCNIFYLCVL